MSPAKVTGFKIYFHITLRFTVATTVERMVLIVRQSGPRLEVTDVMWETWLQRSQRTDRAEEQGGGQEGAFEEEKAEQGNFYNIACVAFLKRRYTTLIIIKHWNHCGTIGSLHLTSVFFFLWMKTPVLTNISSFFIPALKASPSLSQEQQRN